MVLCSLSEFLDTETALLTSADYHSRSQCVHPPSTDSYKVGKHTLSLSQDEVRERIAALRLLRLELPCVPRSESFVGKYIAPVLRVFQDVLVMRREDGSRPEISWTHSKGEYEHVESVRVYYEQGATRTLFCIILFVPQICWPALGTRYMQCSASTLLADFWRRLQSSEHPAFILTTDEHRACILSEYRVCPNFLSLAQYDLRAGRKTLRNLITHLLYQLPLRLFHGRPSLPAMQGVLNCLSQDPDAAISHPSNPRGFRDFDRYTMERSLPDLEVFLAWKEQVSARTSSNPVTVGAKFVVQLDALLSEESLWRCPFPCPVVPRETYDTVTRARRMRDYEADSILRSKTTPISFEVTEVVRHESNTFSQVFFGILHSGDGRRSSPICLKLYLDLMFPVDGKELRDTFGPPLSDLWFDQISVSERLATLHYAEDLARREEAAYDRLREYQGTLIPHCYGFHRFTLSEGITAYGALTEVICGPTVADAEISHWETASQRAFAQHLRHGLRALLYAGVGQGDWHWGQILLPDGAEYRPDQHGLVLIDFAFAFQRFGDEQAPGVVASHIRRGHFALGYLLHMSGVPKDVTGDLFDHSSLHVEEF
ncbi:hypothetical protein MKEN_00651900 [Mycena kentingensis (nom. inval.)]|nr:hypothetical protein MKEN_00651900 [Mycena kentingensis (nom. inval.)]